MEPPSRKRREPWMRGAMDSVNGSTVTSMSTSASPMSGHAHFRHCSASSFAATAKTTTPASAPVTCFRK
jgi:hypothetical protein